VRRHEHNREYDSRTGRPLEEGREAVETLSDSELEAELTIAASEPRRRASRLDAVLLELTRRSRVQPQP
jgi:hypothetical protein